ncbi:MAG: DNA translocase FtsK 4TM domain-containing protein, partial [Deltaproteobacteria bacterium]|nr:DNA translocase FtsK 4TM domain-containing protein [Deltaproteobacteria bacterium]
MLTKTNFKNEILAIFSIGIALFFLLSIVSYSPHDPSWGSAKYPANNVNNFLGIIGAWTADITLGFLGVSSIIIPIFFFFLALELLWGERFLNIFLRLPAWIFLALSFSIILELLLGKIFLKKMSIHAGGAIGYFFVQTSIFYLKKNGLIFVAFLIFLLSFMIITHLSILELSSSVFHYISDRVKTRNSNVKEKNGLRVKPIIVEKKKEKKQKETEISVLPPLEEENVHDELPPIDLLDQPKGSKTYTNRERISINKDLLEEKLKDYGIDGKVVNVVPGPVITMYEFEPAPGIKVSKIANLSDDLAMALSAFSVRIEAPIPGKGVVGLEVPNQEREMVFIREILESNEYKRASSHLTIALGKNSVGKPFLINLKKMPHLLIAGATGSGKSVAMNSMILSILFRATFNDVRFILIDPKMLEFSVYNDIPHLLFPVITDPKKATNALIWAVREMERRYNLMADQGTRNITSYNLAVKGSLLAPLPYIVIIIDELSDLMLTASKDVELALTRLAQMARAAGIHLIIATQRPSVDVLTGVIKANFPARISFRVSSKVDSRTILDSIGAENLLGYGDMLFLAPGSPKLIRIHAPFVSESEILRVVDFLKQQGEPNYIEDIPTTTPSN